MITQAIVSKSLVTLISIGAFATSLMAQGLPAYLDRTKPIEARVADLFKRMTPDEKMDILTGTDFTTRPIPRLNVAAVAMADAGQGVRGGSNTTQGRATAFPSAVAMASTWDPELIGRIGKAIGEEAKNKGTGVQILLGPAVNIHRSPLGGRNGEYFSEDPYLAARLAVKYIQGMQSTGVAACVKHYAANNEEVDRDFVNVHVGERALREIYLPAFEAAVKEGHVWTLMSSYNMVNGYHSSASRYLLTDVLKKDWKFDGMVMSDWGGVHEIYGAINAGNDLEMPGPGFLKLENVQKAVKAGKVSMAQIDENVKRILRTAIRVGVLDGLSMPNHAIVNSVPHQKLTFEAVSKSIVLLKNKGGILPLNRMAIKSIAIIGPAAKDFQVGANGSPTVDPFYKIQPLDGIKAKLDSGAVVRYARGVESGEPVPTEALTTPDGAGGLRGEYFANQNLEGEPKFVRTDPDVQFDWSGKSLPGLGATNYSVRWTGKLKAPETGHYRLVLNADDGCRLFINGKKIIDHWVDSAETANVVGIDLKGGQNYDIKIEYFQAAGAAVAKLFWNRPNTQQFAEAVKAAKQSDVAILCVNTLGQEGEGTDRPSMDLPGGQSELIQAVVAANPRTIVVLNNGTPVVMRDWISKVPGLIETWFPGQEGGAALAAVLFGDVNPSGKLPDTLAARREDYPDYGNFPGVNGQVNYAEGIYVGYRYFDKKHVDPIFPFGFGLSYTTFGYGPVHVSEPNSKGIRTVRLRLTNTGRRDGSEVVEVYIHDRKPRIDKPVRELKAFQKVSLAAGQSKEVVLELTPRAFAYFDVPREQWKADVGSYDIEVAASSRDIRQVATVKLKKEFREPARS